MFAQALQPDVRAAYLRRLGVEPGPPTVELLTTVVRRQAERVPYETLWIAAGQRWTLDPGESARRIAHEGRGGYCYHLNGALALLLSSLGFTVHAHVGGVQAGDRPNLDARGNHLALTVSGLPSQANPAGRWYVDHGLADALHGPLPLLPGSYDQPPFTLRLEHDAELVAWTLIHDPGGGFRTMSWTSGPARWTDFAAQHEWLSTSPDSGFVQVPMAERRDATGVDVIRGLVLSRVGADARTNEPILDRATWFDVLAETFDLDFGAAGQERRDRLWASVLSAHRSWEDSLS